MSTLVAYYSRAGQNYGHGGIVDLPKGNTEVLAEAIAADLGCGLFKIDTVEPYPTDYYATTDQAKRELREQARPAIQSPLPDMAGIDAIVLGYPNWWGTAPMCVFTFLEHYDLTGKKIVPLCTNEGSGMGNAESDLAAVCKGAEILPGLSVLGHQAKDSFEAIATLAKRTASGSGSIPSVLRPRPPVKRILGA